MKSIFSRQDLGRFGRELGIDQDAMMLKPFRRFRVVVIGPGGAA